MVTRHLTLLVAFVLGFALEARPAHAQVQDFQLCFDTADRVSSGDKIGDREKQAGHEACQRALAATSSVTQKYQIQEADFDIVGRPPKPPN